MDDDYPYSKVITLNYLGMIIKQLNENKKNGNYFVSNITADLKKYQQHDRNKRRRGSWVFGVVSVTFKHDIYDGFKTQLVTFKLPSYLDQHNRICVVMDPLRVTGKERATEYMKIFDKMVSKI